MIIFKSEKERERATTIAIAIIGRLITLERGPSKKKQRTNTKKVAKRIKGDNFTRSNREKSSTAIAILEKWMLDGTIIISYFGGSNNILTNYIYLIVGMSRDVISPNLHHNHQMQPPPHHPHHGGPPPPQHFQGGYPTLQMGQGGGQHPQDPRMNNYEHHQAEAVFIIHKVYFSLLLPISSNIAIAILDFSLLLHI